MPISLAKESKRFARILPLMNKSHYVPPVLRDFLSIGAHDSPDVNLDAKSFM
jgi:hypothetical protein